MQLNQYQLLRQFATLRIKGWKRISASIHLAQSHHDGDGVYFASRVRTLARYFQKHGELPPERRGGYRKGTCYLDDESVHRAARSWLQSQKCGSVTATGFCRALNNIILPDLGIALKAPLSNRTARRWMHRLGFRQAVLRKGVYMDGHERPDVVKYRETVFLPAMAQYERRMAQYDGPDLKRRDPDLLPGEKQIIAQFHDESCFHANEYKRSAWSVCFISLSVMSLIIYD